MKGFGRKKKEKQPRQGLTPREARRTAVIAARKARKRAAELNQGDVPGFLEDIAQIDTALQETLRKIEADKSKKTR